MRKLLIVSLVIAALLVGSVAMVSASQNDGKPGNAIPTELLPAVVAYCGDSGTGQLNVNARSWGNASSWQADGSFKVSGSGVAGHCVIPAEFLYDTQAIMTELCGLHWSGKPRVDTSHRSWGNNSSIRANGDLMINGAGVTGRCFVPASIADFIVPLIPTPNRITLNQ